MTTNRRRARSRSVEVVATERESRRSGEVMDRGENVESIPVEVSGVPAYVRVEGSVTRNMGDFNSIRVGICIERPCTNTDEAIQETYESLSDRVDTMISRELDLAENGTGD